MCKYYDFARAINCIAKLTCVCACAYACDRMCLMEQCVTQSCPFNIKCKKPKLIQKTSGNVFSKVVSATFLLVYFLSLKESTCEARKNVFYFTSKALSVLEKIEFQNFSFQISRRHQMPKHKTRSYQFFFSQKLPHKN